MSQVQKRRREASRQQLMNFKSKGVWPLPEHPPEGDKVAVMACNISDRTNFMGPDHGIRPENLFSAKQNLGNRTAPLQVLRVLPWQARRARCFAVHMSKTHKLMSFKKHVFGKDFLVFYNSSAVPICGVFIMFPK